MDKKKVQELAALVEAAEAALEKAKDFADKHQLSFAWEPHYGMGGTYYGANSIEENDVEDGHLGFWEASSHSC